MNFSKKQMFKKTFKFKGSGRPNLSIVGNQPNRTFQPFFVRNYRTELNRTELYMNFAPLSFGINQSTHLGEKIKVAAR